MDVCMDVCMYLDWDIVVLARKYTGTCDAGETYSLGFWSSQNAPCQEKKDPEAAAAACHLHARSDAPLELLPIGP